MYSALTLTLCLTYSLAATGFTSAESPQVFDRTVYSCVYNPPSLYIVISKQKRNLYVYEERFNNNVLVAAYPVCLGANTGNKQKKGDFRTPESVNGEPFIISEICDASRWKHDFDDGRGSIPAYGKWFLRLKGNYVGTGIGIHGSTGNHFSVPGRGSEGCIRLRDDDIEHLKENYAYLGMKVYIEPD